MNYLTIGIFADFPFAATGMTIVNTNLAYHLARMSDIGERIIYFGRYGQEKGFAENTQLLDCYEYVPCQGGVWQSSMVKKIIQKYKLDIVFSEDDWFSSYGLIEATKQMGKPFYFLTPIDSLPIQKEAFSVFKECKKVFVPNQSYRQIPNGIYLPHAVDWMTFRPVRPKLFDNFTFLWNGRNERRKNLDAVIRAFEKIYKKYDCGLMIRTDWLTEYSQKMAQYIQLRRLPIIPDSMRNCPHEKMAHIYSSNHAYICSSKAGGFEMGILEANACGLASLTTDWTFMNENVEDGVSGFLIPIDGIDRRPKLTSKGQIIEGDKNGRIWGNISVDKLAEKMLWMLENQEKAIKMGLEAIGWVRKKYNWRDIATKLYDIMMEE